MDIYYTLVYYLALYSFRIRIFFPPVVEQSLFHPIFAPIFALVTSANTLVKPDEINILFYLCTRLPLFHGLYTVN